LGSYFIDVPAGNIYSISVSADDNATVSGGGIFSDKDESGFYVPTGTLIKVFECGSVSGNPNAFSLVERRGDLSFSNLWIYDNSNCSWTFRCWDAYTSVRTWVGYCWKNECYNPDRGNIYVRVKEKVNSLLNKYFS